MHTVRQSGSDGAHRLRLMHGCAKSQDRRLSTRESKAGIVYSMRKSRTTRCAPLSEMYRPPTCSGERFSESEKSLRNEAIRKEWGSCLLLGWLSYRRLGYAHLGSYCEQWSCAQARIHEKWSRWRNGAISDAGKAGLSSGVSNALLQPQLEKAFVGSQE